MADITTPRWSPDQLPGIVARFFRDGVTLVPGVLSREECAALRQRADELFDSVRPEAKFGEFILRDAVPMDAMYRNLLLRQPILDLAEAILGPDPRYIGSPIIRNEHGKAISRWHIDLDNHVEFPLPDEVPRHDPRIRMPVIWMTFQIALTDIETLEHGPTQFVPGSHYSGRQVNTQENPEFEGKGPESVLCRAGDVYLQNHQCWHRGAPNLSDRTRYILQIQYCQRWAARRFASVATHGVTSEMIAGEDPRLVQILSL